MKRAIILLGVLLVAITSFAQDTKKKKKKEKVELNLTNALFIGQMDKPADRYSIEVNLTDMLTRRKMKTSPSLNIMKIGGDPQILVSDSVSQILTAKGIDTYCLVSVRGYDRRFKVNQNQAGLSEALSVGSLFELYREDIVSVSFEFKFFRNGKFVYGDIIKLGNVGSRDDVLKKFREKTEKRLDKKWR